MSAERVPLLSDENVFIAASPWSPKPPLGTTGQARS
jgi:hypothetical protein